MLHGGTFLPIGVAAGAQVQVQPKEEGRGGRIFRDEAGGQNEGQNKGDQ